MNLGAILEAAEARRKSVTYYAPEADNLVERIDTRNLDVEFRPIPASGPEPFLVIREDGRVRAALSLRALRGYLDPSRRRRGDAGSDDREYAAVVDLLDDTVFGSLSRRQLLLTAREFEDRAWRVGSGSLHVGFQRTAAFEAQKGLYRRLGAETALDVHVYAVPEGGVEPSVGPDLTHHTEPAEEIGRYWFMAFDGGPEREQGFALVAEQRTDGSFYGVWTYDRELIEEALSLLPSVGGENEPET